MDLRQRVQESLSGTHTIERELGGGGMSRVFVADEHRLGRKVVVKVLAPELAAAMSAERFEREIRLAASLQQANILPVISAGDVDGLPFYTMPFVEGESLRARLAEGPVPIAQAVDILRDVAKALSYAHARGVVHRDIKPDNILLSGHTAVVADFGIAKAIVAAQEKPAGATLTQLGTAVGTPAYMAPEQAAGDPDTDHRADVYAYGCMAYELLAGQPPFAGLPPHKLLAAHMNETPRDVRELRPDCPAPLAALVMHCLAKNPAERPATADDVLHQLEAVGSLSTAPAIGAFAYGRSFFLPAMGIYAATFLVVAIVARLLVDTQGLPEWVFTGALIVMALGFPVVLFTGYTQYVARKVAQATPTLTPRGTVVRPSAGGTLAQLAVKASPHMSWWRAARGGIAALTFFALAVAAYLVLRVLGIGPEGSLLAAGKISAQDRVLVAAFDASSKDTALADVVSEAVRTNLAQSRAVSVVPTSTLVGALQRMQRKPTDRVDMALARDLAQREGIKAVVGGTVTPVGGSYIITTRLVSAESGDELAVYRETAKDAGDIIPTVDRLTRKLRGRIGESLKSVKDAPALSQVTTSSLDALRAFAAGLRANDVQGDFPKAVTLFEEAIAKDSGFAAAYVQLSYSARSAGDRRLNRDTLLAKAYRLRDRLPERERYSIEGAYWNRKDRPKAIAAYERAVAIDSTDLEVLNSLALLYTGSRDYGRAERLFRRGVLIEPENGVVLTNFAGTLMAAGKLDATDSLLRDMRARKIPYSTLRRDGDLLYLRGRYDSLENGVRSAMRGGTPTQKAGAAGYLRDLVALRGRFRESDSIAADLAVSSPGAERSSPIGLAIGRAMTDGWFRGKTQQAIARLDSLSRSNPSREPSSVDLRLNLVSTYAILGATDRARTALREAESIVLDSATRRNTQSRFIEAQGDLAMAEGRAGAAAAAYRRAETAGDGLPEGCVFCAPAYLGVAYDRANMRDSAIANLERYLSVTSPGKIGLDRWLLAPTHKRLGELYEAKGDNARAVTHYTEFVRLWEHADPDMQPKVAEARARLERLLKTLPR